jgi:SnoaL-like domain
MKTMTNSKQQAGGGPAESLEAAELDRLMQANIVRVFNERNPDRRLAALDELYTEDATLCDPETAATGRKAISEAIDSLHRMLPPAFVFTSVGHAVGHNGAGRLFWRAGPPDGPAAITGVDVAHIEGGRISLLYVFVDPAAR